MYFKTLSNPMLKRYKDLDGSEKIKDFEILEKFIQSAEFREKQKMRPVTFKDSEEYRKLVEFKALKSDLRKSYLKSLRKAGNEEVKKSRTVLRFEELSAFMKSQEFLTKKNMRPITFKTAGNTKSCWSTTARRLTLK